jgi:geranylgeranyl pyrophosphate synthase
MITARQDYSEFAALAEERARIADDLLRQIRETLSRTGASGVLAEASEYVLSVMGKLVRPLLMLEACRAAGGDPELAFPAAIGTEYGHVASLVHDDIIDGDAQRRGQATLHNKYDIGAALLTGDLFIFQTFLNFAECEDRGASPERVLAAIRMLGNTCIEICQGQALEAKITGDLNTSAATYLQMIRLKTASFCRAAARIGALLGGAGDEAVDALGGFGEHLGMTFQIIDDMLPYVSDASTTGKPEGSDILNRRVTLPVIYAVQSGDNVRREVEEIFQADASTCAEAHRRLTGLLTATHALQRARARAHRYTTKAKQQLDRLPYSPSRERLRALADTLMARDR